MQTPTKEQLADFDSRRKVADEKIKAILEEQQLTVVALPAFKELEKGNCVAVGVLQYRDVKKYETEAKAVETPSVDPTNPQP